MYIQYETKGFTKEDYDYFLQKPGIRVRQSTAHGERNRGTLISFDTLRIAPEEFETQLEREGKYQLAKAEEHEKKLSERDSRGVLEKVCLHTNASNMLHTNVCNDDYKCMQTPLPDMVRIMEDELVAAHFVKSRLKTPDSLENQSMVFQMLNEVMKKAKEHQFRFLSIETLYLYIPILKNHLDILNLQSDVNYMFGLNYAAAKNAEQKKSLFLRELKKRVPDKIEALYIYYYFNELFLGN